MIRFAAIRRSSQRLVMPVLVLLATTLVILGKIDQVMFESLRIRLADTVAPALSLAARPWSAIEELAHRAEALVQAYQQNDRLAAENAALRQWRQTALSLLAENLELRKLQKVAAEPALSFVTARVVATSGGAFMRNVLVDAGSEQGVARGQAALTGDGLVGRVYEVGARAARILSITDLNSRIPIVVEGSRQRGILAGDNSDHPMLLYLDPAGPPKPGDRIVTSGEGGVFPPGVPVGAVVPGDRGAPRIAPFARLSEVEFLRIADYGLATGLPQFPLPAAAAPTANRAAGGRATCR